MGLGKLLSGRSGCGCTVPVAIALLLSCFGESILDAIDDLDICTVILVILLLFQCNGGGLCNRDC